MIKLEVLLTRDRPRHLVISDSMEFRIVFGLNFGILNILKIEKDYKILFKRKQGGSEFGIGSADLRIRISSSDEIAAKIF